MEPRLSFVTLGVEDLERSIRFYQDVLELPRRKTPPEVAFFELGRTWLALYPRPLLAADAGVPAEGSDSRASAWPTTCARRRASMRCWS